jgi:hypothetical protein
MDLDLYKDSQITMYRGTHKKANGRTEVQQKQVDDWGKHTQKKQNRSTARTHRRSLLFVVVCFSIEMC